nr:DUF1329 domain-containing protein [Oceanococcus sp. HetDA_MAG_MS8]
MTSHGYTQILGPALLLLVALFPPVVCGQQYRSEAKGISQSEIDKAERGYDAEAALQTTTDPYARSMLLAQIAAEAAAQGDPEQAYARIQQALELDALSGFAQQQLRQQAGLLAARLGKDLEVIRLLKGANDPVAIRQLVAAYARKKRWREAASAVSQLLDQAKPSTDDRLLDAQVAAGLGDWSRVLQRTEEVLNAQPQLAAAWMLRIRAQLQRGQIQAALASRRAAWRLRVLVGPEQRLGLVGDFAKAGVPLAAASLLEEGLAQEEIESNPERLDQLAALWLQAREYAAARPVLEERLRLAPSAEASLQLGQIALNAGDWSLAARHLRATQRLPDPQRRAAAAMLLGQAEFQLGRTQAAVRAFQNATAHARYRSSAQQWLDYLRSGDASASAVAGQSIRQADAVRQRGQRLSGLGANRRQQPQVQGFTPVGAQAPGNAEGQIPAWTGGLPSTQEVGDNPFADEQPLAVVQADNMDDWLPWLSDGHRVLLQRYPEFRMPVYPSRRSVAYPDPIYSATQKNRGRARLLGSDAISGARLGFPFPAPESGVEAMWNHRLRWRGEAMRRESNQAVVGGNGEIRNVLVQGEEILARYASIADPADLSQENILLYYLTTFGSSLRVPDFTVVVHESANSLERDRAIWALPRSYKKMFRIPPVGYDNPFPGAEGLFYIDMVDMYNGAFDHYDWKLAGKREMLIGYNAFKAQQYGPRAGADGLLHATALNSEALRYEIHRVWVVEATERGGKSHAFGVRRFYLDEDSWNVVLVENFDRAGQMWRVQEGHLLPNPVIQSADCAPVVTYDVQDDKYFVQRMTADFGPAQVLDPPPSVREFRPSNVKNRYAR